MAIWDRPRHARVELRENVYLDAYGESPSATEDAVRAYAGDAKVEEWKKTRKLEVEPYGGEKRGVEINFERNVRRGQEEDLQIPQRMRVAWSDEKRGREEREWGWDRDAGAAVGPVLVQQDKPTGRQVYAENAQLARAITVEPIPGVEGGLHIKINLAELEAPIGRRSPKMEEDFRSTVNTVLARVDVLERGLDARDVRVASEGPGGARQTVAASSDRHVEVERLVERELPGTMSAMREVLIDRAVHAELEQPPVETTRVGSAQGREMRESLAEERAAIRSGQGRVNSGRAYLPVAPDGGPTDERERAAWNAARASEYRDGARQMLLAVTREAPQVMKQWEEFKKRNPAEAERMIAEKSTALHRALARGDEVRAKPVADVRADEALAMPGRPIGLEHVAAAIAVADKGDHLAKAAEREGVLVSVPRAEVERFFESGRMAFHRQSEVEFRGTITEAIKVAEERHGVKAFAAADWQEHGRLRSESPQELTHTIEHVRALIAPEAKAERVYSVRDDGTIHNTVTGRDEYVPVPVELAKGGAVSGPTVGRDGPREGPAAGAKAELEHERSEPEVSVSMS
jgi:hypothetical protein